jgi:hypothetical protein
MPSGQIIGKMDTQKQLNVPLQFCEPHPDLRASDGMGAGRCEELKEERSCSPKQGTAGHGRCVWHNAPLGVHKQKALEILNQHFPVRVSDLNGQEV